MTKFRKAKGAVESRTDTVKKSLQSFMNQDAEFDGTVMDNPCGEIVIRTEEYVGPSDLERMLEKAKELNCFLAIRPSVDDDFDSVGKTDFIFDPQY